MTETYAEEDKKKNGDDSPEEQYVYELPDTDNIRITDLRPGILNPTPSAPAGDLSIWDPDDQVASAVRIIKGQINSSRVTHESKLTGIVVRNPTPVDDDAPIVGIIRRLSKDTEYKLGEDRAYCYVYVPEIHRTLLRPQNLDLMEMTKSEQICTNFFTKVWGDRSTIKSLQVGAVVKIDLKDPSDILYATLELPDHTVTPKKRIKDPKPKSKNPRDAAKDPKAKKQKKSKKKPIKNVLNNETAKKALSLPPPKPRPSPELTGEYHTSVDKELLKGPSPVGFIDWTGCGGGGTLAQSKGRPKSGRKKYYLEGTERGSDGGKMIVSLPGQYALNNASWHKVHRAMLDPFIAMIEQARKDGIPDPFLRAYSCWRSVKTQVEGFMRHFPKYGGNTKLHRHHPSNREAYRKCRKYNGDPFDPRHGGRIGGDHMAGRGVDVFLGVQQNSWSSAYQKKHKVGRSTANAAFKSFMKDKPVYLWLKQNAEFFGFYNYEAEPWHWAFNPDDRPNRSDSPPELKTENSTETEMDVS